MHFAHMLTTTLYSLPTQISFYRCSFQQCGKVAPNLSQMSHIHDHGAKHFGSQCGRFLHDLLWSAMERERRLCRCGCGKYTRKRAAGGEPCCAAPKATGSLRGVAAAAAAVKKETAGDKVSFKARMASWTHDRKLQSSKASSGDSNIAIDSAPCKARKSATATVLAVVPTEVRSSSGNKTKGRPEVAASAAATPQPTPAPVAATQQQQQQHNLAVPVGTTCESVQPAGTDRDDATTCCECAKLKRSIATLKLEKDTISDNYKELLDKYECLKRSGDCSLTQRWRKA